VPDAGDNIYGNLLVELRFEAGNTDDPDYQSGEQA
jgi:hypothetical protein